MTDYVERLTAEYEELKIKSEKLRAFIWDGDVFEKLDRPDDRQKRGVEGTSFQQHITLSFNGAPTGASGGVAKPRNELEAFVRCMAQTKRIEPND